MNYTLVPANISSVSIKTLAKFSDNLKARDKILRFFQYYLKFLVYRIQLYDLDNPFASNMKLLSAALGLHRKAFKLGGWIEEINKFGELQRKGIMGFEQSMELILRSCMAAFLILDNMVYFATLGVLKIDKEKLKMNAYRIRLVCALLQTTLGALSIRKQDNEVSLAIRQNKDVQKQKEKQGQLLIGTTKFSLDIFTYMNSAKYITLDDAHSGIIGSLSSLAAIYQLWCK